MNGTTARSALRLVGATLAAVALAAAAASPAEARSYRKVIRPHQLSPVRNLQADGRTSAYATGDASGWVFYYAPLAIPPGKVLTGMTFQYYAGASNMTEVVLARARPDAAEPEQAIYDGVAVAVSPSADFEAIPATATGAPRRVARGYTYFVSVGISNGSGAVAEIVVRYRDR